MSFKIVLETALKQKQITTEMKQTIEESLFSLMMSPEEMEILGVLLPKLISGEIEVVETL